MLVASAIHPALAGKYGSKTSSMQTAVTAVEATRPSKYRLRSLASCRWMRRYATLSAPSA